MKQVVKSILAFRLGLLAAALGFGLLVFMQACQNPTSFKNASSSESLKQRGVPLEENGEGYQGKISRFEYRDSKKPCGNNHGLSQEPANDIIFVDTQSKPLLVRKDCQDIPAQVLSDVSIDANDNLISNNKVFVHQSDDGSDAANIPLSCPTTNPVPSANMISSPLNLQAHSWFIQSGVTVQLAGSSSGYPVFSITRSSSVPDWSRVLETRDIQAGQLYAFSALAEPGTNSTIKLMFTQNSTVVFNVDVDLTTGVHSVLDPGLTDFLQVDTAPFGAGFRINLQFRSTVTGVTDVALGPGAAAGDTSVVAGVARLHQCQ